MLSRLLLRSASGAGRKAAGVAAAAAAAPLRRAPLLWSQTAALHSARSQKQQLQQRRTFSASATAAEAQKDAEASTRKHMGTQKVHDEEVSCSAAVRQRSSRSRLDAL